MRKQVGATSHPFTSTRVFTALPVAIALAAPASAQWTVVDLHPAGATNSVATGVHSHQQVGTVDGHAALWFDTAPSRVDLGVGAAYGTDGVRQAGWLETNASQGGVWSGTAASFVPYSPPAPYETSLAAVVAIDGADVVGSWAHTFSVYGVKWHASAANPDALPAQQNPVRPSGVHAGQVVGTAGQPGFTYAYLWDEVAPSGVILQGSPTSRSAALGVNAGAQVGWTKESGQAQRAALWFGSTASFVDLHPSSATGNSSANAVFGSIQVGQVDGRAALWIGAASTHVDLASFLAPGFTNSTATGVWTDSSGVTYVSGWATAANGHTQALMWVGSVDAPISYCAGDGSGTACPCGNATNLGSGSGCRNTTNHGGHLSGHGRASISADTFELRGSAMTGAFVLYFQGSTRVSAVLGDGLRCAGGTVHRLGENASAAGVSRYPYVGDQPISVRGANTAGDVRTYQVWYRNAAPFCTPSTFNLSNAIEVTWQL